MRKGFLRDEELPHEDTEMIGSPHQKEKVNFLIIFAILIIIEEEIIYSKRTRRAVDWSSDEEIAIMNKRQKLVDIFEPRRTVRAERIFFLIGVERSCLSANCDTK